MMIPADQHPSSHHSVSVDGSAPQVRLPACSTSSAMGDATACVHSTGQPVATSYGAKSKFGGKVCKAFHEGAPLPSNGAPRRKLKAASSTSKFKGVTKHRSTGKFEAHLWDSSHIRETKKKGGRTRGKQIYLGGFGTEQAAARAYDVASLKFWDNDTETNFPVTQYAQDITANAHLSRQQVVAKLKRSSTGFSRGQSQYRGVTRHHQQGRWEARIGRVNGNKYIYLGTFTSEKEAAKAYDAAAIQYRGKKAVTNFSVGGVHEEQDELDSSMSEFSANVSPSASGSSHCGSDTAVSVVLSSPANVQIQQSQQTAHQYSPASSAANSVTSNSSSSWVGYAAGSTPSADTASLSNTTEQHKHCSQVQHTQHSAQHVLLPMTMQIYSNASTGKALYHEYAPQCGWALSETACSAAAVSQGPDDIVSQAAFTVSEAEVVTLEGLDDDLFVGLTWDDAISGMLPVQADDSLASPQHGTIL